MLFVLTLDHIGNALLIFFIYMAMENYTLSFFTSGPKIRLEETKICRKKLHISEA